MTQAVEDQLTQAGYSEESLMETAELNDVLNYLYEKATAGDCKGKKFFIK